MDEKIRYTIECGEKMKIKRVWLILLFTIVFILLLSQFEWSKESVARVSSSVYVKVKYHNQDLKFERVEYDAHFGEYFVTYTEKNGQSISFTMTPRYFPIYVLHDPLDQPM